MTKNGALIIVMDGLLVSASPAPVSQPHMMAHHKCPGCGVKDAWMPIGDVIQHGFYEDAYKTVFQCQKCNYQTYVAYDVAVYQVVSDEEKK